MTMSLPQPFTLTQAQINDANQKAAEQPAPTPVTRSRPPLVPAATGNGTCYSPGTPGMPDIVIPGTPGVNGSPGTAPMVIPGTPPPPPDTISVSMKVNMLSHGFSLADANPPFPSKAPNGFVASAAASIATGWSEPVSRGGSFASLNLTIFDGALYRQLPIKRFQ